MQGDDPQLSRRALLMQGGVVGAAATLAPAQAMAAPPTPAHPDHTADRFAINDTLLRYFRALDRVDEPLLRQCFAPDAALDYTGAYVGGVDGFVDYLRGDLFNAYQATMHFAGNMVVEVDGDRAFTETYCIAHHMPRDGGGRERPFFVMWLRYIDQLTRESGWRIARRSVVVEWVRSDSAGMWEPYEPATARRDRSDPSYRR